MHVSRCGNDCSGNAMQKPFHIGHADAPNVFERQHLVFIGVIALNLMSHGDQVLGMSHADRAESENAELHFLALEY